MTYVACPYCGGGIPGVPCHCSDREYPLSRRPLPQARSEDDLMLRIAALAAEREAERQRAEKAEAEVERLREALKDMQDLCARSAACGAIARAALRQDEGEGDDC